MWLLFVHCFLGKVLLPLAWLSPHLIPSSTRLLPQIHSKASPLLPNTQWGCLHYQKAGARGLIFLIIHIFKATVLLTAGFKHQILRSWQWLMSIFFTPWTLLIQKAHLVIENWSIIPWLVVSTFLPSVYPLTLLHWFLPQLHLKFLSIFPSMQLLFLSQFLLIEYASLDGLKGKC